MPALRNVNYGRIGLGVLTLCALLFALHLLLSPETVGTETTDFDQSRRRSQPVGKLRVDRTTDGAESEAQAHSFKPKDDVVMSTLGNATVRAELGRATWTLLHTMAARFPEEPTIDQQATAFEFLDRLSSMYPCGQCARHFKELLRNHPPELRSRVDFMQWMCDMHNIVNKRLDKPQFDCSTVESRWKCGCTEEV